MGEDTLEGVSKLEPSKKQREKETCLYIHAHSLPL